MDWLEDHDLFLCREVLVMDPFQYPYRSKERGDVWGQLVIQLNSLTYPVYKVGKRSVRDRLTLLQNRHKEKIGDEERDSGIDCEETELSRALEEINEKELSSNQQKGSPLLRKKRQS